MAPRKGKREAKEEVQVSLGPQVRHSSRLIVLIKMCKWWIIGLIKTCK